MARKNKIEITGQTGIVEEQLALIPVAAPVSAPVIEIVPREIILPEHIVIDKSEQGTPEWLAARAGLITGSCFVDIIGETKPDKNGKTKPLKARENYLWKCATEIVNGVALEGPSSFSLQWGHDVEPFAREAYEAETGYSVDQLGFITRTTLPGVGVSLDGAIDKDGTYESKCPKDSTVHMMTWFNGMPEEHIPQVQGGLWVTGREWCDYVSYDPRCQPNARLYIQRIYRDEAFIANLAEKVAAFRVELDELVLQLRTKIKAVEDQRSAA